MTEKILRKAISKLKNTQLLLQDQLDAFYYNEQQCMLRMTWDTETFDNQDFFELNKVMSAEKVDTISDFQTGAGLSDGELLERHTSREKLEKQAGMQSIAGAIQHHKEIVAAKQNAERKEETS